MSSVNRSSLRRPWCFVFTGLACGLLLSSCCTPPQPTPSAGAQAVAIETVIDQVKEALADVQNNLYTQELPPLSQISLKLQTIATDQGGGSVKLWVITLGGTLEKDSTQQIEIVLKPPTPGGSRKVSSGSVVKDLETAIMSVAEGVKKAGEEPNPLTLANLDVEIAFAVKATANGAGIIEILPLGPSLSGSVSKTATQTLKVSFAAPSPTK